MNHTSRLFFGLLILNFLGFGLCGENLSAEDNVKTIRIRTDKPAAVSFEPAQAQFLRINLYGTNKDTPAIDELELFAEGSDGENLARKEGVKISASSTIEGYAIHRVENLNDGQYGNDHSWVSGEAASEEHPVTILCQWPEPVKIGSVLISRDRNGQFSDRITSDFEIFLSNDGENWRSAARIHGIITNDESTFTAYGSGLLQGLPGGKRIELSIVPNNRTGAAITDYEKNLYDAFLAEENALLKIAGCADIEPWLLQRHYPEYVEPRRMNENILPLPAVDFPLSVENSGGWDRLSAGSVIVYESGNPAAGGAMMQEVAAGTYDGKLYLKISGNRFVSEHIALISTEGLPVRGFLAYHDHQLVWRQIDPAASRAADSLTPVEGRYDEAANTFTAALPLDYFPNWESGLFVSLGIGGRNTLPGGHPVHFKPASFSLAPAGLDETGQILVQAEAFGSSPVKLGDQTLAPNQSVTFPVKTIYGPAGPACEETFFDENENRYQISRLDYDPVFRPFCQLTDMLRRLEAENPEEQERIDFEKRFNIPGVLNPRYSDPEKIVAGLNIPADNILLEQFCTELESNGVSTDDPVSAQIEEQLLPLWKEYQTLRANGAKDSEHYAAVRTLYQKVRLLKRELFLSDDDLEPVEHLLANKRHPFHPSHNYSDLFDSEWQSGGAVVKIDIPRENGRLMPEKAFTQELVQAGDGIIRNPSLSFDATKLYYALRASKEEYFRIHELDLTTGQVRRISADGPFHDFWPTELPDGNLAFVSTRCKKKFICWRPQAFVLHRMNKNGEEITPLSFANLTEFAPSVMNDGRIIWTRSEYVDKGADYGHTLWTIRIDGTMPELVFGNTINLPQGYANGREVPETREVCCVMISHFGDLNGPVTLLDLTKGPHEPASIRSITPEVPWPGFWGRSETFREPFPISRNIFLAAHAPQDRFGIYLLDRFGNRELLTIDERIDTICPQPFAKRDVPPVLRGVIKPDLAEKGLGQFSIANVYRGLEGQVEPGSAKYLRICREMPTPLRQMPDGTYQWDHEPFMEYYASPVDILQGPHGWPSYVAKGVVGTVEIEKDGSADFLVPAGQVLFFQLLDENFNEIQRMRSVVQLQNGEQRSCIGCHESRLSTPEGSLTLASKNPGQTLQAPPWGAGPFWYERTVQPVLDRRCVECHTAETAQKAPRQFDLTGTLDENKIPASYRSLIQSGDVHYFDYTWGAGKTTKAAPYTFGTFQSKLWEILRDENHKNVTLEPEEEQAIKCWTDLNVPLWGDYQFRSQRETQKE